MSPPSPPLTARGRAHGRVVLALGLIAVCTGLPPAAWATVLPCAL